MFVSLSRRKKQMRVASNLLTSIALACSVGVPLAPAQDKVTEHTYRLAESESSPNAVIDEVAWLAGHWLGEGLGGISEEVWSPPRAGAMMGAYRLIKDGKTAFYEILTIMEERGSLVFRLKHFNADLTAWEEKEKTVDFPLVKLEKNAAHFRGLSLYREGDVLTIYLALHQDDGSVEEAVFRQKKVNATKED
jgi:hypothetical protein